MSLSLTSSSAGYCRFVAQKFDGLPLVKRKLQGLQEQAVHDDWPLRAAAAVLGSFDTATIQPLGSEPADREPALRALLADCTPVTGRDLQRYALRPEARREAIARLGNRDGIQAALNANPIDAGDLMQRSFAACLRGELAPLRQDWPLWRTSSWGAGLLRRLYKFH